MFDSLEFHLSTLADENDRDGIQLGSISRIEAFFEANKFKGYAVTIQTSNRRNNISFEFEAFFTPRLVKETIIVPNLSHSSSKTELISQKSNLLQNLIRFIVSTDFDSKERQFANYASIMDQTSDPALLMDFDPIDKDIEFWITWTNSLSIKTKIFFLFF